MSVILGLLYGSGKNRHGLLIADRRISEEDGSVRADCRKIMRLKDGSYLAMAGECDGWFPQVVELLNTFGELENIPTNLWPKAKDISALWLRPGPRIISMSELQEGFEVIQPPYEAIGAGRDHAKGALAALVGVRGYKLRSMNTAKAKILARRCARIACAQNNLCGGPLDIRLV